MPALVSGGAGLWLALHHPLWPSAMPVAFIAVSALLWAYPRAWLIAVPASLPVLGLAPWTGWITFEEFDLLLLAAAAGGYGRLALSWRGVENGSIRAGHVFDTGALAKWTVTLFVVSALISTIRAFLDAGGATFGWHQGYDEPLNSLRLAKPLFFALLLWPLWRVACADSPSDGAGRLSFGLTLGLLAAASTALWERLAYTGLLDFSTDYRTTALFWEMHVGGAAIDGFVALTMPFAAREMISTRRRWRWATAAVATVLGGYACLSTFSRALYVAVPVGLGVLLWLHTAQRRRLAGREGIRAGGGATLRGVLLVAGFAVAGTWIFPAVGYRGLLALLGTFAVLLPLADAARRFRGIHWLRGLSLGAVLIGLAAACSWASPKGAYAAYALAATFTVALLGTLGLRRTQGRSGLREHSFGTLALAGFAAMLAGMVLVALHWGGGPGLVRAVPVSVALLGLLAALGTNRSATWSASVRWQGTVLAAMLIIAGIVGVFGGGSYMGDRFANEGKNFGGRLTNWRLGLAMLDTPADWIFGKGLGRFPADLALALTGTDERPGDYRFAPDVRGGHLVLGAGTHRLSWLSLLRFSQRVAPVSAPAAVRFDLRASAPVSLLFEVCEKHLLYSETCLSRTFHASAASGQWQTLQLVLDGKAPSRGAWYAPRLIVFSVAVQSEGGRAELDNLVLAAPDGADLLANGDFDEGLARWFFTSDGYHTPWHIEGILMNALFDQGVVGAVLLVLLVGGALWRTSMGDMRDHAMAPALAGALIGFAVAGSVSSVTDVPRVAFLFYFLLLLGMTSRMPALRRAESSLHGRKGG